MNQRASLRTKQRVKGKGGRGRSPLARGRHPASLEEPCLLCRQSPWCRRTITAHSHAPPTGSSRPSDEKWSEKKGGARHRDRYEKGDEEEEWGEFIKTGKDYKSKKRGPEK